MNNIRLFHISHTDLDGYACQFLTNEVFPKKHFYNANYGLEVKQALKLVITEIKNYQDEIQNRIEKGHELIFVNK